ncbi:MAG TPA: retron St85 family effector protein [Candidatus Angelobacter sp.]|jgi:hypothetical protein|nr:retron St85 family effector protein [Candidatus Angelobacter sp.]
MASWLAHPRYVPIREGLINHLRRSRYRFRKLDSVIFLCGAAGSKSRDAVRNYLARHTPGVDIFYAEKVWQEIASLGERDALQMEEDLAKLADLIIVIVESAGTLTELGAFSISTSLRQKLLPIVDEHYQHDSSFITNGPLRWIDAESAFRPTIYTNLSTVLSAVDQIGERINRIPASHSIKVDDLSTSPKHLLFFICDLISVIYPASLSMINHYVSEIVSSISSSTINVPTLIGLAVAMDLLRPLIITDGARTTVYYAPVDLDRIGRPFHHSRLLYLEARRAEHAAVLLAIPEAKAVLDELRKIA